MSAVNAAAGFFALASLAATAAGACRAKRPLGKAAASGVCGVSALGLAALLAPYTGMTLGLNWFTAFAAVVLGAPGVITLLVLRVALGLP